MKKPGFISGAVLTGLICLVFGSVGGAVAGGLVTGKQIKNNTIKSVDVKDGGLKSEDLSASTRQALQPLTIPSGSTVRGHWVISGAYPGNGASITTGITLPIPAPVVIADGDVLTDAYSEGANLCTGTLQAPTAPRGKVCVYSSPNDALSAVNPAPVYYSPASKYGFGIAVQGNGDYLDTGAGGTWAYTAP